MPPESSFFLAGAETPIAAGTPPGANTSEDVAIDPNRKFILSPNEQGTYQIVNASGATPVVYNNVVNGSPEFDSAGEDCTTGFALATEEDTSNLFIADLSQALDVTTGGV